MWICLTQESLKVYYDDDGNLIFKDINIDEQDLSTGPQLNQAQLMDENNPVVKILEKLVLNQEQTKKQNVRKTAERFVLEKFNRKNANTQQWIEFFESECARFDVIEDKD